MLLTTRQFETADARLPRHRCPRRRQWQWRRRERKRQPAYLIVLVDVPERAVIRGIDCQVGVIAPAGVGSRLHTGAVYDRAFAQSHLAKRIASKPAGVSDTRKHGGAIHYAIAKSHVTVLILGDAAQPAMDAVVWCKRSLLIQAVGAVGSPNLVPARASNAGLSLY